MRILTILIATAACAAQTLPPQLPIASADITSTVQMSGQYAGKQALAYRIMGRRAGFTSTSVLNDIVEFGSGIALIPTLTGSEALEIVSTSANDTAAGTGVQSVQVTYVNNAGNMIQTAPIALSGTTPVPAGFTTLQPEWMETSSTGTGGIAAGDIVLRVIAGPVQIEEIAAGENRSHSARFMVPTGYTGYISDWSTNSIGTSQDMRMRGQRNAFTGAFVLPYITMDNSAVPGNTASRANTPYLAVPALATVKISTIAGALPVANRADTEFTIILLHN